MKSTATRGSGVVAGGTAAFVATGYPTGTSSGHGTPGSGNVTIAGSNVNANDVILAASNQINLVNTTDTGSTRSANASSGAGVGVFLGTQGFGVVASMSKGHGNGNGDAAVQNNTHVMAANTATIISGGDTSIVGSNVNGRQVNADVGGNLNIVSVQDAMSSVAHQQSSGGGFAISQGGGSASFSSSHGDANGSYAGVDEQAGIQAGDGGFSISVKGNTDLRGAVIASNADASKNNLSTGTLTFSDIQNQSGYDAHSGGFSAGATAGDGGANYSTQGNTSGQNAGGPAPVLSQNDSGNDSATTKSGISAGTINVTDPTHQTQDIASLNRDTSNTNGTVAELPDVNNLLERQEDMMAAAGAAGEAVSRRMGAKYEEAKANGDQAGMDAWEEGGISRAEMQAAGAALVTGLAGGNVLGGAAGAGIASIAAGKLNELSGAIADSNPTGSLDMNTALGNIVANMIATGAGAAVGGDAGAFSGYNVDRYNRQLHPDERSAIAKQANGDQAEQDKLTKAACLAVKCWVEYPVGSYASNANYVSQLEASQLEAEIEWVNRQQEAGLFAYTPPQKIADMVKSDPLGVGKDALKVGVGIVTAKTGGLLCGSAVGCAVGGWMFAFGTSDAIEGATSLTNRYEGITASGWNPLRSAFNALAPTWGSTIYDGINLGTALVALKVPVPLNVGTLDGLNRPTTMFDVMVPNINNAKSVPFVGPSTNANQASLWLGVGTKGATFFDDVRSAGDKK